jgi:hypothetical protein
MLASPFRPDRFQVDSLYIQCYRSLKNIHLILRQSAHSFSSMPSISHSLRRRLRLDVGYLVLGCIHEGEYGHVSGSPAVHRSMTNLTPSIAPLLERQMSRCQLISRLAIGTFEDHHSCTLRGDDLLHPSAFLVLNDRSSASEVHTAHMGPMFLGPLAIRRLY